VKDRPAVKKFGGKNRTEEKRVMEKEKRRKIYPLPKSVPPFTISGEGSP